MSGVKCLECLSGVLLPTHPLEYYSTWSCNKVRSTNNARSHQQLCFQCSLEVDCDKVETIVSQVEQELNTITNSGEFHNYKKFIMEYSDVILHKNHFLLTMARITTGMGEDKGTEFQLAKMLFEKLLTELNLKSLDLSLLTRSHSDIMEDTLSLTLPYYKNISECFKGSRISNTEKCQIFGKH